MSARERHLTLDLEALAAYSRRGNFHSDPAVAAELGFDGPIAQGMQVVGPAYAQLLDDWGETFLERGVFRSRFRRMVVAGTTVVARVLPDDDLAGATYTVRADGELVAEGSAERDGVR